MEKKVFICCFPVGACSNLATHLYEFQSVYKHSIWLHLKENVLLDSSSAPRLEFYFILFSLFNHYALRSSLVHFTIIYELT